MTFFHMLYQLLIGPLELILETVFGIAQLFIGKPGISILVMSLVMNLLLLPLYKRADAIQEEQREKEKSLSAWVGHIRKTFRGDERYLMLQTYYRQNGYKPFYALKGLMPLLLEIPFFIAAYHFLSNLQELRGAAFAGKSFENRFPDAASSAGADDSHQRGFQCHLYEGNVFEKQAPALRHGAAFPDSAV